MGAGDSSAPAIVFCLCSGGLLVLMRRLRLERERRECRRLLVEIQASTDESRGETRAERRISFAPCTRADAVRIALRMSNSQVSYATMKDAR